MGKFLRALVRALSAWSPALAGGMDGLKGYPAEADGVAVPSYYEGGRRDG